MPELPPPTGNWKAGISPPILNAPWSVLGLIAMLVAIHAALAIGGENWRVWSLYALALIPARFTNIGLPMLEGSQYWSLATYGLLHADWVHLLVNSLWLLVFGTPVARYLGAAKFLALSLIATVAGGLGSLALHWDEVVFVLGASGAVSGLLAAAIPLMYGVKVPGGIRPLGFMELLRNGRALALMGIWLAVTLVSGATGWTGNSFVAESGIAWEAHLGGFIGGLAGFYAFAERAGRGS